MKNNLVMLCFVTIIIICLSSLVQKRMQQEAVKAGVAHYVTTAEGDVKFEYIQPNK